VAIPQVQAASNRTMTWSAARYLAARMATARTQAIMRSATVALRFIRRADGVSYRMFADGNRDGVRAADIAVSIDYPLGGSTRLADMFPRVDIAVTSEAGSTDPVRVGTSDLLSFTAIGTATPGSIYVRGRDGLQLAIRIFGPTGRTRIQRFDSRTARWLDTF
jgi:hypothetical protein